MDSDYNRNCIFIINFSILIMENSEAPTQDPNNSGGGMLALITLAIVIFIIYKVATI